MAATGCLTIESAGAARVSLRGSSFAMVSPYEHWSDAFDGPHDTGTTARNRLALRNGESAGVERAGTPKRRTRVALRDQLDPGAQHVASLFAGTEEQIRTAADRAAPKLGVSPGHAFLIKSVFTTFSRLRQGEDHREGVMVGGGNGAGNCGSRCVNRSAGKDPIDDSLALK
jgi:hypothetical protein